MYGLVLLDACDPMTPAERTDLEFDIFWDVIEARPDLAEILGLLLADLDRERAIHVYRALKNSATFDDLTDDLALWCQALDLDYRKYYLALVSGL
jgi:hypothetical protein